MTPNPAQVIWPDRLSAEEHVSFQPQTICKNPSSKSGGTIAGRQTERFNIGANEERKSPN
jgi:hypothetical protein